jgi:serine/threonine protein kinase
MIMTEYQYPRYPLNVARAMVIKISQRVEEVLRRSRLFPLSWIENDSNHGKFLRNELIIGDLIGKGEFSEVYAVLSIKTNSERQYEPISYDPRYPDYDWKVKKYAIKHTKNIKMSDPQVFCSHAADLVVEGYLLSVLHHPNIVRLFGWTSGGTSAFLHGSHDSFFLVLERLVETLTERIEHWKKLRMKTVFKATKITSGVDGLEQLFDRVKINYQIASAMEFLHGKNIIYRDLKADNVGFDEYGTVKVFDFGLSRELPEPCFNVNDTFSMTGKSGTLRYMAPEVVLGQEYNQKADTYSWAVLFWECLSLEKPFEGMTREMYQRLVCQEFQRPDLACATFDSIKNLLSKAWAHDIFERLTMVEVCAYMERIQIEIATNTEGMSRFRVPNACTTFGAQQDIEQNPNAVMLLKI